MPITIKAIQGNYIITDTDEKLNIEDYKDEYADYIKQKKKRKIEKIATLTDQLNLMAGILAEQIEAKQESERTALENKALKVYKSIQDILNSDNV